MSALVGKPLERKEDYRFLTGAGLYTDDVEAPRALQAYFLRSPHAHARIRSIDTTEARSAPGVAAIYTGADLEGKMNGLPCGWLITDVEGQPMKEPPHPPLAIG
jgi:carbon-monoxide dehydrogenase large subunit